MTQSNTIDLSTLRLYHYYEADVGPFCSLTALEEEAAEKIQHRLHAEGLTFAAKRTESYLAARREIEQQLKTLFIRKGGLPQRVTPHYMLVEPCEWLRSWYKNGRVVCFPLSVFPADSISFTYGDSFPALRYQDGRPYRGQVYTLEELASVIEQYGFPQDWNRDGKHGPERYIEAQIWTDIPVASNSIQR